MKNSLFDLEDRVIVVTGAAGVLAGGTARYLLEQGAKVVMLDLKQEVVDQIVADAKATISPKVSGYACNVLDRAMIESVYEKVMAEASVEVAQILARQQKNHEALEKAFAALGYKLEFPK